MHKWLQNPLLYFWDFFLRIFAKDCLDLKHCIYRQAIFQVKLNVEMKKKAINHFLFSYYILINFLKKISGEGEGNTFLSMKLKI